MNAPLTRLPDHWVESLLARMLAIYGQKFRSQWADVPAESMRETWAVALGRFDGERIKWALDQMIATCPWPPTLPEFAALCRQAPRDEPAKLPAPEVPPSVIEARQAEAQAIAARVAGNVPSKGWAHKLRARYLAGERLMMAQVSLASDALGETWTDEDGKRECRRKLEEAA